MLAAEPLQRMQFLKTLNSASAAKALQKKGLHAFADASERMASENEKELR